MAATSPTPADLRLMLEVPFDTSDSLLIMAIDTAELFVTENLANKNLTDARLTKIWLYLACHFALMTIERGGVISSRSGDQSQEEYGGSKSFMEGLTMTRFGSQAITLDTSGTLRALAAQATVGQGSQLPAQFRVVGGSHS